VGRNCLSGLREDCAEINTIFLRTKTGPKIVRIFCRLSAKKAGKL